MSASIRTNAHPVILSSKGTPDRGYTGGVANPLLTWARDCFDGDLYGWAMELLFATQVLRVAYDSPRIGGGIDPGVATGVPSLESGVLDSSLLRYLFTDESGDDAPLVDGPFAGMKPDARQDAIVHAEAVALRLTALCERTGRAY